MDLSLSFRYLAPAARLHAGPGALGNLGAEAERAGARRALVVASETVGRTTDLVTRVERALAGMHAGTFAGAKRESPLPSVMAGVAAFRKAEADLVVAVGGGSAIVTARAITILAGEGKSIGELYTHHRPGEPPRVYRANAPKVSNILVPTTPTTGADRGGAAVYDEEPPHRKELYDPKTRPLAILADPDALLSAPVSLYLDTALTTFCGLLDAVQSPALSALAFADYREGLDLCLTNLPRLVARPEEAGPRMHLFVASVLANRGSQSSFNLNGRARTSGVDRVLRYRYPHIGQGASNAVLLPWFLRVNRAVAPEEQAQLAALLNAERPVPATDPADFLESFLRQLGVATRLRDLGVPREDLSTLAQLDVEAPGFGQGSARIDDAAELTRVLETAW